MEAASTDRDPCQNSAIAPRPAALPLHCDIKLLPGCCGPPRQLRCNRPALALCRIAVLRGCCQRRAWTSAISIPNSTLDIIAGLFGYDALEHLQSHPLRPLLSRAPSPRSFPLRLIRRDPRAPLFLVKKHSAARRLSSESLAPASRYTETYTEGHFVISVEHAIYN